MHLRFQLKVSHQKMISDRLSNQSENRMKTKIHTSQKVTFSTVPFENTSRAAVFTKRSSFSRSLDNYLGDIAYKNE